MCVNDWRIGTQVRAVVHSVVTNGGAATLQAHRQRVGVLLSIQQQQLAPASDEIAVQVDGVTALTIPDGNCPYLISILTHGDLPTRKLFITNDRDVADIYITEFFLPEEVIAAGYDEFKRRLA